MVQVKNPETGDYYGQADLFVGKRIEIFNHGFILTDLDGFSMTYMQVRPAHSLPLPRCQMPPRFYSVSYQRQPVSWQEHPDVFPYADVERIKNKLAEQYPASAVEQLRQRFVAADRDGSGTLDRREFAACLELENLNQQVSFSAATRPSLEQPHESALYSEVSASLG